MLRYSTKSTAVCSLGSRNNHWNNRATHGSRTAAECQPLRLFTSYRCITHILQAHAKRLQL